MGLDQRAGRRAGFFIAAIPAKTASANNAG